MNLRAWPAAAATLDECIAGRGATHEGKTTGIRQAFRSGQIENSTSRPPSWVPTVQATEVVWRGQALSLGTRVVPEETAIAFTYAGTTHAVMMATPADLEDLAFGFTLSEQLAAAPSDVLSVEIAGSELGIDLRIALSSASSDRFWARRRARAGPVGCGLCGIESLREAVRSLPCVSPGGAISADAIHAVMRRLPQSQPLHGLTHAVHAAAFWQGDRGVLTVREDVGRHNALDKLCGAIARRGEGMRDGVAMLTSRVSVEMVQKLAVMGCPILVAVSAPTALAIATARSVGMTLVAIARDDGFEVFTHPHRITYRAS